MVSEPLKPLLKKRTCFVLILVLVEDGLRGVIEVIGGTESPVLILVLVEDGLRDMDNIELLDNPSEES